MGFLISFLHTMIRMSLVITLAGGMAAALSPSSLGWSCAVELDPSLDSVGPSPFAAPPFLFLKLKSSPPPRPYSS